MDGPAGAGVDAAVNYIDIGLKHYHIHIPSNTAAWARENVCRNRMMSRIEVIQVCAYPGGTGGRDSWPVYSELAGAVACTGRPGRQATVHPLLAGRPLSVQAAPTDYYIFRLCQLGQLEPPCLTH